MESKQVRLASGLWEIECLPEDGGRIATLRFAGRDFLTRAPDPFTPPAGDFGNYETRPVYGYDDCFPSVDPCTYPARERFDVPLCAYNVSGEYAMLKAAAERGWLDEKAVALEMLTAIKRAGASFILTYWAKDVARWLG